MTHAITGRQPSKSSVEQAKELFSIHDTIEDARNEAERWLRNGAIDVNLWEQVGVPIIRQVIEWEWEKP